MGDFGHHMGMMRLSRPAQLVRLSLPALVVLAVVAALSGLGLAHRVPTVAERALAVYQLAGVGSGDLCADGGSAQRGDDCPACRLSGSALLPTPLTMVRPAECRMPRRIGPVQAEAPRPAVRDPAHGLRAPPVERPA